MPVLKYLQNQHIEATIEDAGRIEEIDVVEDDGMEEVANYLRNVNLNDGEEPADFQRARPRNFWEFIERGTWSEPIRIPVDKNRGEVLLMNLKFALANNLSWNDIVYGDHWYYVVNERVRVPGVISDIYDGQVYIDSVDAMPEEDKHSYITGSVCADGAEKFKNSRSSAWPVYYQINELPRQARMKHQVLAGLYHHKKKPNLALFLDPSVDMMNRLTQTGIVCTIRGEQRRIKPYVNSACFDAAARAPGQGVHQ
ncbi:hypothetical protein QAD02_007723 [Eretmocerus hayati]|uniref:Uncharacterized protein n=1 Tax=Eretmocerus hayati TaxID=131215 RepID=A0ACC2N587_9HYME|nr:hypothetical protein QAD02_007723 [Eretmocerus hayati]